MSSVHRKKCQSVYSHAKWYSGILITIVVSCISVSDVLAQTLEEIVVTAQRREENIQDVPIAISAFTGEALEVKALTQVAEVADYTPNVYMDPTTPFGASNNILAAYIRGIGQSDFAFNLEPGVGVYLDGVYLARTIGANVDLLDVDRLEILKGPQGTLFGRNTIGGAINVVTRTPGNDFSYRGEVTTGSFSRVDIRGAIEGPIIEDKLYASIAFSSKSRRGYQEFVPFPGLSNTITNDDRSDQFIHTRYDRKETAGGENQQNIRAKLVWDASDDLQIQLSGAYSITDEDAIASSLLRFDDDPASFTHLYDVCIGSHPTDTPPLIVIQTVIPPCFQNRGIKPALPSVGAPQFVQPALNGANLDADPNNDRTPWINSAHSTDFFHPDIDKSYATGINFSKLEISDIAAHVDYDLANEWHLKFISAYRRLQFNAGMDLDGSPLPMLEVSFDTFQEQYSNEFQLSGLALNGRWDWIVGVYQFHEEGDLTDYVTFPGGFLQIYGENFFDTDAWAIFTHNNIALTDHLGLTIGARYTDEAKEFEGRQRDLNMVGVNPTLPIGTGCLPPPAGCSTDSFPDQNDLTRYYPLGVNSKDFTDTTITAGLDYSFNDDVMTYFSYSEGFKSGGWTTRLSTPHLSISPNAFQPLGLDFDEENATSYELGLKSQFLDNSLQLNLAFFFMDYENIQVTKQVGASPVFDTAGDGEITGTEAEFVWLPSDNFVIEGSIGWQDAEYTSIDAGVFKSDGVTPLTTADAWVNVPEWDTSLAGTYSIPMQGGGTIRLRADWYHTSEIANDLSNTPELMQGEVDFFNASATYVAPSQNWELVIGGRNITDERHIITGQHQPAAGIVYGTYNRPAEWFLTIRVHNE
jgi:iron complex outermembrane receptor protein